MRNLLYKHVVDFYSQGDQNLEVILFSKRILYRLFFRAFDMSTKTNIGCLLFLVFFYLLYNKFHAPSHGRIIYAFGPTRNNENVFKRLKEITGYSEHVFESNGRRLGFFNKFKFLVFHAHELLPLIKFGCNDVNLNLYCRLQLLMSISSFWFFSAYLLDHPTKLVVIANDHAPLPIGLIYASKQNSIPVCYFQHAPVNSQFPPLQYDLSILHDRHSLEMYKSACLLSKQFDSTNVCFLSRFKSDFQPIRIPFLSHLSIGIGLSFDTSKSALLELINNLNSRFCVERFVLKRHPRDRSSYKYLRNLNLDNIQFIDDDNFFNTVDFAIVSNSGITIDCLHNGLPTFYWGKLDDFTDDYYGFVRSALIPRYDIHNPLNFKHFEGDWVNIFARFDSTVEMNLITQSKKLRHIFFSKFDV